MCSFRNVYDRVRVFSCPGNRFEPTYKLKISDNGVRDLKIVGQVDTYQMIQSHKDSVDLNLVLQRFANGDASAIHQVNGVYGDFTNMPQSLSELSQRVIDAEDLFNSLPVETRREFNHSPSQFFASIGTEKFTKAFIDTSVSDDQLNVKVVAPVLESEVPNE